MDAYRFWKNVDAISDGVTLVALASKANLNYRTIKNQRSGNRMPGISEAYALAKALGTSIEFLLTGNDTSEFPPRILAIAKRCMDAEEDDLRLIEKVLNIKKETSVDIGNSGELA